MKLHPPILPPALRRKRLGTWWELRPDVWVLRLKSATPVAEARREDGLWFCRLAAGPDTWHPWLDGVEQLGEAQLLVEQALALALLQQGAAVKQAAEAELRRRGLALPPSLAREARLRAWSLSARARTGIAWPP